MPKNRKYGTILGELERLFNKIYNSTMERQRAILLKQYRRVRQALQKIHIPVNARSHVAKVLLRHTEHLHLKGILQFTQRQRDNFDRLLETIHPTPVRLRVVAA